MTSNLNQAALAIVMALSASTAWSHGETHGTPRPQNDAAVETAFGKSGDPAGAARTIAVVMSDAMRFSPASVQVKRGETVRFVVSNEGRIMHEMVLGTMEALKQHAALMRKHPGMEHDEPHMAHVAPGRTETLTWQFTKPGDYYFGCLIPGHFEAGMIGKVAVR